MLHAPLPFKTATLDISLLLKSSPSPPSTSPTRFDAPRSRSSSNLALAISPVQPLSSQRTPASSNLSPPSSNVTSSTPSQAYGQPQRPQLPPLTAPSYLDPQAPPLHQQHQQQQPHLSHPLGKRPPPTLVHPLASPAKKQSKWTPEEDALIIDLRGSGMKWEDISKRLPGRSAISCRLHYQNYLERRSEWDEDRKNRLARLYERLKADMWAPLAAELSVPWRAAEAMHWQLGEADMARRAGVTPFSLASGASTIPGQENVSGSRLGRPVIPGYQVGGGVGVPSGSVQQDIGRNPTRVLPGVAELEGGRRPSYDADIRERRGPFPAYEEDARRRYDVRRRGG